MAKSGKFFCVGGYRLQAKVGRRRSEKEPEGKFFPGWWSDGGGGTAETDEKERKNLFLETPADLHTGSNVTLAGHFLCAHILSSSFVPVKETSTFVSIQNKRE